MDKGCHGVPGWGASSDGREVSIVQCHRLLEIGVKLRYLCHNKLPRIIFVLMYGHDYVISHITGAGSSALIDGKAL